MRILEIALKTEARKVRWHMIKLYMDVWVQITLYAFLFLAVFFGQGLMAFYVHFFGLGFYQLFSSIVHPFAKYFEAQRQQYDKWLIWHLLAFIPCMLLVLPLVIFMLTSSLLALYYLYITILEFNHYTR